MGKFLFQKVHSSIVTLAADEALISTQATSLEKKHAAFALSLAHEAEMIISLRMLDTGTARDVSGVLRITNGGGSTGHVADERELLYFVGGDGGVRVFERGQ
jgi:elongator complex protein 6